MTSLQFPPILLLLATSAIDPAAEPESRVIPEIPNLAELEADLKILAALDAAKSGEEEARRRRRHHMKQLLVTARRRRVHYNKFMRERLPANEDQRKKQLRSYREWTDDKLLGDLHKPPNAEQPDYRDTFRFDARILRLRALMQMRNLKDFDAFDRVLTEEFGTSLKKQQQAFFERYLALVAGFE